jgi:phage/plasmid primase-like uncharacterized protein
MKRDKFFFLALCLISLSILGLFLLTCLAFGQGKADGETGRRGDGAKELKLSDEEAKNLKAVADEIEKLAPQVEAKRQAAEKAVAEFQAAQASLNAALAAQAALFFKAAADRQLKPETLELNRDKIQIKPEPKQNN